ncbi:LuxR C-terminal-related transcriptional regulator [Ralstonia mannitolilytica]
MQRQILEFITSGLSDKAIAEQLNMSPHNVDYHLRQLKKKYGAQNRVQLAYMAEPHAHDMNTLDARMLSAVDAALARALSRLYLARAALPFAVGGIAYEARCEAHAVQTMAQAYRFTLGDAPGWLLLDAAAERAWLADGGGRARAASAALRRTGRCAGRARPPGRAAQRARPSHGCPIAHRPTCGLNGRTCCSSSSPAAMPRRPRTAPRHGRRAPGWYSIRPRSCPRCARPTWRRSPSRWRSSWARRSACASNWAPPSCRAAIWPALRWATSCASRNGCPPATRCAAWRACGADCTCSCSATCMATASSWITWRRNR